MLKPDRADETRRAASSLGFAMNPDGQPWPQRQLGPFGYPDDVAARTQRIENAPFADPLEVFGRAGAAENRQPAQLVCLVVGRGVCQHVRLRVFDADHALGSVGDRLSQCEEIRAGKHTADFVVDVLEGSGGTSCNMNVNEVIANLAA